MSRFYDVLLAKALAGGGGESGPKNYVEGEFTTQATEGAQTITIPYEGEGYPIALVLYSKGGVKTWYTSAPNSTVGAFYMAKYVDDEAPTYKPGGLDINYGSTLCIYKNSSGTQGKNVGITSETFTGSVAAVGYAICVRFTDNKTMSVFITTGSGYALAPEMDYVYKLVYSE